MRRLLWPAVLTAIMLGLLMGLGVWQVERLAWKQGILAQIAAAEHAPPVQLNAAPGAKMPSQFTIVQVSGQFIPGHAVWYGSAVQDLPHGTAIGADLVLPLARPGLPPLLVDLGWVPTPNANAPPNIAVPPGEVRLRGYIRETERPGLLAPADDVAGRHFYTPNPARIGAAMGLAQVAPAMLIVLGPVPEGGYPLPHQHLPQPPNNHLSYAITWFGLAVVLLVIFLLFARKALRP